MSERITYLDSSAIVKRYLEEGGTPEVSTRFKQAYSGDVRLSFSIWNVGEVLGALDKAVRLKRMKRKEHELTRTRFLLELQRMVRLKIADAIPLRPRMLLDSWRIVEEYHVYEADALQVATAKHVAASEFLTGDMRLHEGRVLKRPEEPLPYVRSGEPVRLSARRTRGIRKNLSCGPAPTISP